MSEVEHLTVTLPEPVAARVHAAVKSGEYATVADVVREAVDLWAERRSSSDGEIELLRQAWDEGVASGEYEPLDIAALVTEARARRANNSRG